MPFLSKKNTDACHQNSNTVVHGRSIMSSAVSPALIVIFISFYFHYFLNWLRDSIYLEIDGSSKIVTEFILDYDRRWFYNRRWFHSNIVLVFAFEQISYYYESKDTNGFA
jgi:hypothetical protein